MRTLYDDFDDFEFDDNETLKRMLREQAREELRNASRRRRGPGTKQRWNDEFDDELDDFEDDDYEDFEYDEDEFDQYAL